MNLDTLHSFFMWCTIINGGILIYSSLFLCFAPDFIYRIQSRWYRIPRDRFDVIAYSYLGLFKVLFFVFNLSPYLALTIMT